MKDIKDKVIKKMDVETKESKNLLVAIIGYGGMGQEHFKLIQRVQGIIVRGVYDIKEEKRDFAISQGLIGYPSLEAVMMDESVDILLIATPNQFHKSIAIEGLKANKHVISEKPVTLSSEELIAVMEVEKNTACHFFVHQNRRWDEDYLSAKKVMDEKLIGDVFHIESRVHGSRGIPGDWRREKASGGGMMLDWGVHLIDRLLIMMNETVTSLYCKMSYIRSKEVDDGFMLHLTFESGKTALIEVGTYNYINLPLWYVLGSEGALKIDDWSMNGQMQTLMKVQEEDAKPIIAGAGLTKTMAPREVNKMNQGAVPRVEVDYAGFYKNIIDVIINKAEPVIKNQEVLRVMRLMEAAFVSSFEQKVIVKNL